MYGLCHAITTLSNLTSLGLSVGSVGIVGFGLPPCPPGIVGLGYFPVGSPGGTTGFPGRTPGGSPGFPGGTTGCPGGTCNDILE